MAGTGTDRGDWTNGLALFATGESGGIGNLLQLSLGLVRAAGENERSDRAIDHALPEAPAQRKLRDARVNGFAETADEAGEIADPRRQHSLDALAHAARHHV